MKNRESAMIPVGKRLMCFVMILVLLISFAGCVKTADNTKLSTSVQKPGSTASASTEPSTVPSQPQTVPTQPGSSVPATTVPSLEDPDALVYVLTQEDVDLFYQLLTESEELALAGEDLDAIETSVEALDECFAFLNAQCSIAMILHYSHTLDSALEQQYLSCMEICTEANDAYLQMARRVYQSDTPAKDMLFEGWTEEEIDSLLAYDEEIAQIQQRNAEIGVAYRTTTDDFNKMKLYIEFVQNNNRIAEIYGYDSYYTYAYENVYGRDYDLQAVEQMRAYAQSYLCKSLGQAYMNFNTSFYRELSYSDQFAVQAYLSNAYNQLGTNYVQLYMDAAPAELSEALHNMLEHDSLFANASDSMAAAFTTTIGERSYCYYGPGYDVSSTIIHEGGHYYASLYSDINNMPLDLAETHSQGNEWMFVSFMKTKMPAAQHDALVNYLLYDYIAMTLICLMVDEFEQVVYTTDISDFAAANFDAIMNNIAKKYFPNGDVSTTLADVNWYWRQVVVEQPIYYMSYAVSGTAAVSLYTMAEEDYDHAMQVYQKLCQDPILDAGFLENIAAAGLYSPFDKAFYLGLEKLLES